MIDAAYAYVKDPTKEPKWNLIEAAGEIPTFKSVVYASDFSENIHAGHGRRTGKDWQSSSSRAPLMDSLRETSGNSETAGTIVTTCFRF